MDLTKLRYRNPCSFEEYLKLLYEAKINIYTEYGFGERASKNERMGA